MRCALSRILLALTALACSGVAAQGDGVVAEQRLDSTHSVELIEAAGQARLVVVSNLTRQEVLALDRYETRSIPASPQLELIGPGSAYLHFYGDYGFYYGSRKYLFNVSDGRPARKIPYSIVALTSVSREGEKLNYSASFAEAGEARQEANRRSASIVIEPRSGAPPNYTVTAIGPARESVVNAASKELSGAGGELVIVQNQTPPGQPHRVSTIFVDSRPFPAPIPTLDLYRQKRPQAQPQFARPPAEIESDIGPFVQRGDKVWFATTFYDGEGVSGIGAIGTFDVASRKYEMRYLPEIVPWSGSAILLDGDDLWIGLVRRPEGANIGGGLLRYGIATGTLQTFAIPDVIFTLDRVGDAIYCGTSHGLYMVRAGQLTQLRFEPNETGQLVMIPRVVPQTARSSAQ